MKVARHILMLIYNLAWTCAIMLKITTEGKRGAIYELCGELYTTGAINYRDIDKSGSIK
jgi:hypothetical protein